MLNLYGADLESQTNIPEQITGVYQLNRAHFLVGTNKQRKPMEPN